MTREELIAGVEAYGRELSDIRNPEVSFMQIRAEAKSYQDSLYPLALFLAWLERQEDATTHGSTHAEAVDTSKSLTVLAKVRPNHGYEKVRIIEAIGKDSLKVSLRLDGNMEMFPVIPYDAIHQHQQAAAREYARNLPGYTHDVFFDETEPARQIEAGMRVEPANRRTRGDVLHQRANAVGGGCCERFANQMACNCLEMAQPD